jgi:hypothetical protein
VTSKSPPLSSALVVAGLEFPLVLELEADGPVSAPCQAIRTGLPKASAVPYAPRAT